MDNCSLNDEEMFDLEKSIKKAIYCELLKQGIITESDMHELIINLSR